MPEFRRVCFGEDNVVEVILDRIFVRRCFFLGHTLEDLEDNIRVSFRI